MNNIKSVESITNQELNAGIFGGISKGSWHEKYSISAWIFLGGFALELSEGDLLCVMSQWGEIEDINLVRDKATNKSKGFAFIKYEDQRSTILAVDNFNGIKLLNRILRCDHVDEYRLPKDVKDKELEKLKDNNNSIDIGPGHAYKEIEFANEHNIKKGVDLWSTPIIQEQEHTTIKQHHNGSIIDSNHKRKHSKNDKTHDKKDKKHKHDKVDRKKDLVEYRNIKDTLIDTKNELIPKVKPIYNEYNSTVASWRGSRDPSTTTINANINKKTNYNITTYSSSNNNNNNISHIDMNKQLNTNIGVDRSLSGIGGMKRTR